MSIYFACSFFVCWYFTKLTFIYKFFLEYEYTMSKMLGLIWVQTVNKGYHQTVGKYLRPLESFISPLLVFTLEGTLDLPAICLSVCLSALTSGFKDNSKTIQASFMKLGMWTGGKVLIMHTILFLLSHENCGCYGNGNGQTLSKTYRSRD